MQMNNAYNNNNAFYQLYHKPKNTNDLKKGPIGIFHEPVTFKINVDYICPNIIQQ